MPLALDIALHYHCTMSTIRKADTIPLRISRAERAALERAAAAAHLPLSTWVRQKAMEAAESEEGAGERRERVRRFLARLRSGAVKGARAHAAAVERAREKDWDR